MAGLFPSAETFSAFKVILRATSRGGRSDDRETHKPRWPDPSCWRSEPFCRQGMEDVIENLPSRVPRGQCGARDSGARDSGAACKPRHGRPFTRMQGLSFVIRVSGGEGRVIPHRRRHFHFGRHSVGIGTSIFLIAVGAVLKYAVTTSVSVIGLDVVGVILMIAGIVGVVLSLLWMTIWADRTRGRTVARDGVVRE